ncbi:mitochondrial FAD carrier protein flx1 [Naganishia albida]|nr:mitochondrial FAD carrier protein flx1 [Naganishia albida]
MSSSTSDETKPFPALFGDASIDHAIAGLGAGTIATLVMHPLDLVKVRFQLANNTGAAAPAIPPRIPITQSAASTPIATSTAPSSIAATTKPRLGTAVYSALRDCVKQDGWTGLYRGLMPNLVGGASSWGLYFLFYNLIKKQMQGSDPSYQTTSSQHLLAAAEASAVTAMLTNPIWVVKTRVFASTLQNPTPYKGLIDGLPYIYRTEGLRGLYKGSLLALVGVSNGSIQFATYEEIKAHRTRIKRRRIEQNGGTWRREDEKLSSTEYIAASGISKLVAIALTYPYQVVRARIQNAATSHIYPDIPTCIRVTYRQEGLLAFYKGLGTNALRILPGTCTTLWCYEQLVWGFRSIAGKREALRSGSMDIVAGDEIEDEVIVK